MITIIGWLVKIYNKLLTIESQNNLLIAQNKQIQHTLSVVQNKLQELENSLNVLKDLLQQQKNELDDIKKAVGIGIPVEIVIKYTIQGVEQKVPITITDAQAVVFGPSEKDAAGNDITNMDFTQFAHSVSDPTAFNLQSNLTATSVTAPDGQSIPPGGGWLQAKQEAGHLGDFQLTINDTDDNLTVVDTVTVTSSKATSLGINFGTPQ